MGPFTLDLFTVDFTLALLFVLLHAIVRFERLVGDNAPAAAAGRLIPIARACTTAPRYYLGMTWYVLLVLLLFLALASFPERIVALLGVGGRVQGYSHPLVAALLLTTLLPNVPLLSHFDRWLRTSLHRLAAIPGEVIRLSRRLREGRFTVPEGSSAETERRLAQDGCPTSIRPGADADLVERWRRVTAVMLQLERWNDRPAFNGFRTRFHEQWASMEQRYDWMRKRVHRVADVLFAAGPGEGVDELTRRHRHELKDAFEGELKAFERSMFDYLSHGVLSATYTQSGQRDKLRRMGFEIEAGDQTALNVNNLAAIGLTTFAALTVAFTIMHKGVREATTEFPKLLMIVLIYLAAVVAVVVLSRLKSLRGLRGEEEGHSGPPVAYYLLVGATAAATGAAISLIFRVLRNDRWGDAWEEFAAHAPWLLMSAATASGCAALFRLGVWRGRRWTRMRDGAALALCTAATSVLVLSLLPESAPARSRPEVVVPFSALIGFGIGFLAPMWHRDAQHAQPEPPDESQAVAPTTTVRADASDEFMDVEPRPVAGRRIAPPIE